MCINNPAMRNIAEQMRDQAERENRTLSQKQDVLFDRLFGSPSRPAPAPKPVAPIPQVQPLAPAVKPLAPTPQTQPLAPAPKPTVQQPQTQPLIQTPKKTVETPQVRPAEPTPQTQPAIADRVAGMVQRPQVGFAPQTRRGLF